MANGIRIQPTDAVLSMLGLTRGDCANRPWRVLDHSRPADGPPFPACKWCGEHKVKTYHLGHRRLPDGLPILDADGTTMISTVIWEKLQALHDNGGFEKVNVVATPPVQNIVLPTAVVDIRAALLGGT